MPPPPNLHFVHSMLSRDDDDDAGTAPRARLPTTGSGSAARGLNGERGSELKELTRHLRQALVSERSRFGGQS